MTQEEQTEETGQTATSTGEAGRRLKVAREAQNLSLDDIAKQLKSSAKMIEALENEDSSSLPQSIYVSGYLKSYAGLLGLPAAEIISAYPNLTTPDPVIPNFKKGNSVGKFEKSRMGKKSGFKLKLFLLLLLVGAVVVASMFYFKKNGVRSFVSDVVTEKLDIRQLAGDGSTVQDGVSMQEQRSAPLIQAAPITMSAGSSVSSPVSEKQQVEDENNVVEKAVEKLEEIKTSRLLLEFSEESWVEVTDARGERLAYRLAKAPSRRLLEGVAPFKVFVGYAPGVTVNYNGLPYDLVPHTDGDVAQLKIGKAADNELRVSQ